MRQRISRPRFHRLAATLLAVPLMTAACAGPTPPERVFLITIDTLRADHLGAYGYPRDTSPFLDRLAAEATVFEAVSAASSHTAPCHASLFTALEAPQHRLLVNGETLHPEILTVAELYRRRGYRTAGFTTVGFLEGLRSGFEHFEAESPFHPAGWVVDRALGWLGERDPGEKLFVWVHLFDAHEWYVPQHLDAEAQAAIGRRPGLQGDDLAAFLLSDHAIPEATWGSRQALLEGMDRYDGQILAVDRELERLYSELESRGLTAGSAWVVTADHGEGLANHGFFGHGRFLYGEQLHVPLIVHAVDGRWPAGRVAALVRQVDVAATLADLAGASFGDQILPPEGRSLLTLLRDPAAPWPERPAFALRRPADEKRLREGWSPGEVFALRTARAKVVVDTRGGGELYDLAADPLELDNLWAVPSELQRRLWRQAVGTYRRLLEDGERVGPGAVDPKHLEELEALGYL